MTTLSVIVPVRDVEPFITDTLVSLQRNARDDFEFLVVDDGSTDATPEILAHFAQRLPQLTVLRNESAVGLANARNQGLERSRGRYLTYLDGDDWLAPGYLPDLVSAIERLDCDFVRVDHVQATQRMRVLHRAPEGQRGVVLNPREAILPTHSSTMVDYPFAWAGIYQRRLADQGLLAFPADLHTAEDRPWIWRLHRKAESFAVVSLAGLFYRRGVATSLTQVGDERQLQVFRAFDLVLTELREDSEYKRFLPKAVRNYCAIIAHHFQHQERFEPGLRKRFRTGAVEALRAMPQEELAQALIVMDPERAETLRQAARIEVAA